MIIVGILLFIIFFDLIIILAPVALAALVTLGLIIATLMIPALILLHIPPDKHNCTFCSIDFNNYGFKLK
jgi:hypothetical protein